MSNLPNFLQQLWLRGIRIWAEGDKLRCRGPEHQLTPALLQQIKAAKPALLSHLSEVIDAPLSYGQQGLWYIQQGAPENFAYNVSIAFRVSSPIELSLLNNAAQLLVNRHAALRTTFAMQEQVPVQRIHGYMGADFAVIDASGWNEAALLAEINVLHKTPFDLASEPLLRMRVLAHAAQNHIIVISAHHIIIDGWSIYLMVDELFTLYDALVRGTVAQLPIVEQTFADYVAWQQALLEREGDRLWSYWQTQLQGELPVLELPTDYPRPAVQELHGISHSFVVDTALTQALKALAQQQNCTLYMVLLAAYQILLYRYSGQDDLLIGLPMAGRSYPGSIDMIGYFTSPVVIRADLGNDPSFTELLSQVRNNVLVTLDHQDYPFPLLVERLNPPRDPSRAPIFQADFALQRAHRAQEIISAAGKVEYRGLVLENLPIHLFEGQLDLSLALIETAGGLRANFMANRDLFLPATLTRMANHFEQLLRAVVATPSQSIAKLSLLTPAERHQLLVTWNDSTSNATRCREGDTSVVMDAQGRLVHQLFEEQVEQRPDAVAVILAVEEHRGADDGGITQVEPPSLTYREVNERANQLAHYLQTLGVGPETTVGICVDRSLAMVVGVMAVLKAGGIYVPLDPSNPRDRLLYMIQDTQIAVLVTEEQFASLFVGTDQTHSPRLICLDRVGSELAQQKTENLAAPINPDDLAYVIYTSGSTGHPKGVMIEQLPLADHIVNLGGVFEINRRDRILQFSAFSFDAAHEQIFLALCHGATLILRGNEIWTGDEFNRQVIRHEITLVELAPVYFQQLITLWLVERPHFLDGQMRLIEVGGEAVQPEMVRLWQQLTPSTRLLNIYGPTEATITATSFDLTHYQPEHWPTNLPIGRPFPGRKAYILDHHLQPVPIGLFGELYIGGNGVGRGYLNRPELTAECFIANPFVPSAASEKLYKTGDIVRWLPDGTIEFIGRVDNQVKIRGYRVELGEIEHLLAQHPQIGYAVVLPRDEGRGDKRLVAYIVPNDKTLLGPTQSDEPVELSATVRAELRDFLQRKLPQYMIPTTWVALASLPVTANGKVNRDALPVPKGTSARESVIPPRTPTEQQLATIWSEVLQLDLVDIQTDFFEAGGHSILAVQLMQKVQQHFQVSLPLATLFQYPTIETLGQLLVGQEQMDRSAALWSPLVPIRNNGIPPVGQDQGDLLSFFCVHSVGGNVLNFYALAQALPAKQPFYGLQAVGLDGETPPQRLLEEMAFSYIAALQQVQPTGPYIVGGHSFGGEVAFEMARQLQQQGEEIALLVLLDSYAPGTLPSSISGDDEITLLMTMAHHFGAAMGRSIPLQRADFQGVPAEDRLGYLTRQMQRVGLLPPGNNSQQVRGLLQVFRANMQMRYRPPAPINVPTVLFRADSVLPELLPLPDETLGWQRWIMEPVVTHIVSGDHFSMLGSPHVQTLAAQLTIELTRAAHRSARVGNIPMPL